MKKEVKKTLPLKEKEVERKLRGAEKLHHDLFRLEMAVTRKNISFNSDQPIWEPIEHKHFYHNVDSSGKPLDKCAPSAGHFHRVVTEEVDGKLVAHAGPAMKMVKIKGKNKEIEVDAKKQHTHNVTYLQSELVTKRVYSNDALQVISKMEAEKAERLKNPAL